MNQWLARKKYEWFTPSNVLKIRNVGKSFVDRDVRMFHAVFTVLCDFVETEATLSRLMGSTHKEDKILASLYDWYNTINWDDPVPVSPEFAAILQEVNYEQAVVDEKTGLLSLNLEIPADIRRKYFELAADYELVREEFKKDCQEKLETLVSLRSFLWT